MPPFSVSVGRQGQRGFTLVEAIMVIVITGALAATVAIFIVPSIQGYFSSVARGEMVDMSDAALRRIGRDLHLALPNSVRVSADSLSLELLPVTGAGRYYALDSDPAKRLDFGSSDGSFALMSPKIQLTNGQYLVFYNLGPGVTGSDAYATANDPNTNRRSFTGASASLVSGDTISMNSAALPIADLAPPYRFHAIGAPVSYVCTPSSVPPFGQLTRYTGYAIQASQPVPPASAAQAVLAAGSSAVLASGVTDCAFVYEAQAIAARAGLVTLRLQLSAVLPNGAQESVNLYHAVHVDNLP